MLKRRSLVCQHLENISRQALEQYQEVIRSYVRGRHGIYALHRKGKLSYVGLAKDLYWRLKQHLRDRHANSWDRFSMYLTIEDGHLKELESLVLRIVKPADNKVKGKFRRSENLRRRFAADIRALQREQLYDFIGKVVIVGTTRTKHRQQPLTGVLHTYMRGPMKLRAIYKGRKYRGYVRNDGSIRVRGKLFNSPSMAANAIRKGAVNGWYFWRYERAPGDWVKLNELRK